MALLNLNIRGRLILGFSVLCALLAVVVGTTIVKVRAVNESTDRTVNLRVPTAMAAGDVVAGVYASLASLRGWLITGNDTFKAERATLWKEIQRYGSRMDNLSGHWTVEQNKADWKQAKPLLDELRSAQDKAEAIAHTIDEQPAAKMLATEAAPLAKLMLQKATSIIDEEGNIASTDARKSLLIDFADLRGSMAMAIGAIRAYLLTADLTFKNEFEELWALNQKKFEALAKRRSEMTSAQQSAFDALVARPRQILAAAAENVRNPRLGPLEHGAVVPDQRGGAARQQAARHLRGRKGRRRLAFGRYGFEAAGQSETGRRCRPRRDQLPDDAALGAARCRHRRRGDASCILPIARSSRRSSRWSAPWGSLPAAIIPSLFPPPTRRTRSA